MAINPQKNAAMKAFALAAMFFAFAAHGREVAIRFDKMGDLSELPDGWTHDGVSLSPLSGDYKGGLKFGASGNFLQSPLFDRAIRRVSVSVCCNKLETLKRLTFFAMREGVKREDGIPFEFGKIAKDYDDQTLEIQDDETDSFRLEVLGKDGQATWYVMEIVVSLDEAHPIVHEIVPDPVVEPTMGLSNCWKVSEFEKTGDCRFAREADFSFAEKVKTRSVWTNGASADSFYAFSGGVAVSNIYPSTYKSSPNGLYAVLTNEEDLTICALGLQATDEKRVELLLPIALDSERKVERLAVEFRGWEPKVGTARTTTLMFHWCAADSLEAIEFADWFYVQTGEYSGGNMDTQRMVRIPGRDFRGKKFIGLKWSVKNQANSSLLAISDLRVTADLSQSGSLLLVR